MKNQRVKLPAAIAAKFILCCGLLAVPVFSQATIGVLKNLRPAHPRLFATADNFETLKKNIRHDRQLQRWRQNLERRAESILAAPSVERILVGPRLLAQSRQALTRISLLAGLYRLDGDKHKAERAKQEMLAAAAFPDWNPAHFLDVAEMTNALAIGYDWLYEYLTPAERAVIRQAIVDKGLKPGLKEFENKVAWTTRTTNWNTVCNGGLTVGALAIADEEPELAGDIINRARLSIANSMRSFAPDGGWEEGPPYWNYHTTYTMYYLGALETALGTDFSYKNSSGLKETGLYRIHAVGPLGLYFNYADGQPTAKSAPQMFWLAKYFNEPQYVVEERKMIKGAPSIFHLLWSQKVSGSASPIPTAAFFKRINVVFFRSDWKSPNATYIGFKGGDNQAGHAHLDLGTFVLDALGERWAIDLGPDDYDLPNYFDSKGKRWVYYRLRTEGHNTITLNGENQNLTAKSPIIAFENSLPHSFAVADLTAGYAPKATKALRGIALLNGRDVLVQDEFELADPAEIIWNFHTAAQIELKGKSAILTQNGKKLYAKIISPVNAKFEIANADPIGMAKEVRMLDLDGSDTSETRKFAGHKLIIRLPKSEGKSLIAVSLSPTEKPSPLKITPLSTWKADK